MIGARTDCLIVEAAAVERTAAGWPDAPIVAVLPPGSSDDDAISALEAGADECLAGEELDGPLRGRAVALAVARRRARRALRERSLADPLTGLPGRGLLDDRLGHALATIARHPHALVVLFVDVDRFKTINDTYGHHVGDAVLVEVARRLGATVRPSDTVARYGGDEFVLICDGVRRAEVPAVVGRVRRALAAPVSVDGAQLLVRCSVGAAVVDDAALSAEQVLRRADAAMYRAKRRSRRPGRVIGTSVPMGGR